MNALFWDDENGGYFFSGKDNEKLISNDKEIYDSATPSGNSVAAIALVQMGYLTGETEFLDKVDDMYYTFFEDINRQASAGTFFMQSILLTENPTKEVVILRGSNTSNELFRSLAEAFTPDISLLIAEDPSIFSDVASFASEYKMLEDKPTIYVCENFACQQPTI